MMSAQQPSPPAHEILDAEHACDLPRWQFPDFTRAVAGEPAHAPGDGSVGDVADGLNGNRDENCLSPPTAERLECIEAEAREQGYRRGLEEGREAARESYAEYASVLEAMLGEIAQPLAELDHTLAEEIVGLAVAIAKRLVRREISADPAQIVGVVREALALLPSSERRITLHLHPQDARLVRDLLQLDELERPWRIVEEPTISRGGVRVLTQNSEIDATLETRLGAVIASVMADGRSAGDSLHSAWEEEPEDMETRDLEDVNDDIGR